MYESILAFFVAMTRQDPDVLAQITAFKGELCVADGQLRFTLAGLKQFLFADEPLTDQAFQQLLYGSYLNRDLAEQGGRVDVYDSEGDDSRGKRSPGKVADNWYCLVLLAENV